MFKLTKTSGQARTGTLETTHGIIHTPFFMPVATFGTGRGIGPQDYTVCGVQVTISNSFLLSLKPGLEVLQKMKGLSAFSGLGITFTDSGGFQSNGDLYKMTSRSGVHLKSPFDGKTHILTPQKVMQIQNLVGSDIAMVIDDMAPASANKKRHLQALERTHRWAAECKKYHQNKKQLLFCIVQGGYNKELRAQSAEVMSKMDFDGYAIGGCAIGEPKPDMYRAITSATPLLPEDKPRYLMGVGSPPDVVQCVALGVDCFDSIFPTMNARHNTIFTFSGPYNMDKAKYAQENKPLEKGCDCWVCANYSLAYVRHLASLGEAEGKRLRQVHNTRFMMRLMENIRQAIKTDTYEQFRIHFLDKWFKGKVPKVYSLS